MVAAKTATASRDQPHINANFLVEFGAGAGGGFAEVIFAPFNAGSGDGAPLGIASSCGAVRPALSTFTNGGTRRAAVRRRAGASSGSSCSPRTTRRWS